MVRVVNGWITVTAKRGNYLSARQPGLRDVGANDWSNFFRGNVLPETGESGVMSWQLPRVPLSGYVTNV